MGEQQVLIHLNAQRSVYNQHYFRIIMWAKTKMQHVRIPKSAKRKKRVNKAAALSDLMLMGSGLTFIM